MDSFVELFITYQDRKKLIIEENGVSLEQFILQVQKAFKLEIQIKFIYNSAEITSVHSFSQGRSFSIESVEESLQVIKYS